LPSTANCILLLGFVNPSPTPHLFSIVSMCENWHVCICMYVCIHKQINKKGKSTSEKPQARTMCLCSNECNSSPVNASQIFLHMRSSHMTCQLLFSTQYLNETCNIHSYINKNNARGTKSFTERCISKWCGAYSLVSLVFLFINYFNPLQWISSTSSWYPSLGKRFGTPNISHLQRGCKGTAMLNINGLTKTPHNDLQLCILH
jgi:hypothetical protein